MRVAHICPPKWGAQFPKGSYRMALAHWLTKYPEYVRDIQSDKAYIIMDNGAFESQQQSVNELILAAKRVRADEVVLPDVPGDGAATLKRSWEAYKKMTNHRVMFVPQGHTVIEWRKCLDSWLRNWGGNYLAIGIASLREDDGTPIFESKTKTLKYAAGLGYPIHILGMTTPKYFAEELLPIAKKSFVRGVDTSTAFALGARGILLTVDAPKIRLGEPETYPALTTNSRRLIQLNMAILDGWMLYEPSPFGVPTQLIRQIASKWLRYWQEGFASLRDVMQACGLSGDYILEGDCIRTFDSTSYTGGLVSV